MVFSSVKSVAVVVLPELHQLLFDRSCPMAGANLEVGRLQGEHVGMVPLSEYECVGVEQFAESW